MIRDEDLQQARILWDYHCRIDQLETTNQARLILGLGSYDLRVANYCAWLYLNGYADKILFSGRAGNWTVGRWDKTEAEIFRDVAIKQGVPAKAILLEKMATNLGENLRYSKELVESNAYEFKEVILVTKPNTTRRAYAVAMIYWPLMQFKLSAPELKFNMPAPGHDTKALIEELVGDMQRIINYPHLGYQIPQEVPTEVYAAYQALIAAGYSSHCQ